MRRISVRSSTLIALCLLLGTSFVLNASCDQEESLELITGCLIDLTTCFQDATPDLESPDGLKLDPAHMSLMANDSAHQPIPKEEFRELTTVIVHMLPHTAIDEEDPLQQFTMSPLP